MRHQDLPEHLVTQMNDVVAQDRGYSSEEFTREPETVEAKVTAEVLACPLDAGIPPVADDSTPDAGSEPTPPPLRPLCIENGSFEDDPIGEPWISCPIDEPVAGYMITEPATPFGLQPIDGARYLRLDATPVRGAAISQKLCAPSSRAPATTGRYRWRWPMAPRKAPSRSFSRSPLAGWMTARGTSNSTRRRAGA